MQLSLIKIRSIFPHFNEAPLTADDFWSVVERHKIVVAQQPMIADGYYTQIGKRHFILLDSSLSGFRWLHTAFHELYHYMFDVPCSEHGYIFYRNGEYTDRREYKADAFALIGMMPWPELLRVTPADIIASPALGELVRDRIVVRTYFGI